MSKHKSDHHKRETHTEAGKETDLLSYPSHEELQQKLDEAEKKANQYWERILRMQADNENSARRTERDVANAHKYALEKFASDLIPIIDSLELCLTSVPKETEGSGAAVIEGVNLTLRMFYTVLEKYGIKQINPVDEPFDPHFQQAISVQFDPAIKPGMVMSVLQKGYTLNDRLLRPALVIVSKAEE